MPSWPILMLLTKIGRPKEIDATKSQRHKEFKKLACSMYKKLPIRISVLLPSWPILMLLLMQEED